MGNTEKIAKALSDPIRYRILKMLAESSTDCCSLPGEKGRPGLCNCELMESLGMIQSRVSYHLKELAEAGLVNEEPRGRWKFYRLNQEALRQYLEQLIGDFKLG
jgi:ArsR family transcriptional regulator